MFAFTFDVGNSTDLYFLQLWIVHTYNTYVYIVFGRAEEPIFFASGKFHYGLIITEYFSIFPMPKNKNLNFFSIWQKLA